MDIAKKGMTCIGFEYLFIPAGFRGKETGLGKAVQFNTNGIGRFPEFTFHITEIGSGFAVQKKLKQQLDPRLGRNKSIEQFPNIE